MATPTGRWTTLVLYLYTTLASAQNAELAANNQWGNHNNIFETCASSSLHCSETRLHSDTALYDTELRFYSFGVLAYD